MNRRLVRSGGLFDSEELERGEVELELPEPFPEPEEEDQVEPWGLRDGTVKHHRARHRLREYKRFLKGIGDYE
jgi:hypothetical protein